MTELCWQYGAVASQVSGGKDGLSSAARLREDAAERLRCSRVFVDSATIGPRSRSLGQRTERDVLHEATGAFEMAGGGTRDYMGTFQKLETARTLWGSDGLGGITRLTAKRFGYVRRDLRRWLVRDRAWVGRLFALFGNTASIEGCRFSFAHPHVTDELRCRALLGRYERSEREVLARHLDPTLPVLELGGGLGVVACLTNRRLRDPAAHVVVEANPSLVPLIKRHRSDNGCRFAIVNAAIDYAGNTHANLRVDTDFISARVDGSGDVCVPTITLGRLLEHFSFTACTLICDIEGVETTLVEHESALLARRVAILVVETHPEFRSDDEIAAMSTRLRIAGFVEVDAVRKVRVYRNARYERV